MSKCDTIYVAPSLYLTLARISNGKIYGVTLHHNKVVDDADTSGVFLDPHDLKPLRKLLKAVLANPDLSL